MWSAFVIAFDVTLWFRGVRLKSHPPTFAIIAAGSAENHRKRFHSKKHVTDRPVWRSCNDHILPWVSGGRREFNENMSQKLMQKRACKESMLILKTVFLGDSHFLFKCYTCFSHACLSRPTCDNIASQMLQGTPGTNKGDFPLVTHKYW